MITSDKADKGLAAARLARLRDIIRDERAVRVDELCEQLGVSAATVRRDLERMEQLGEIRRVHGGAVSVESRLDEPLFDDKTSLKAKEKRRIAQKALSLIQPDDTIYLDGGSTVLELARLLRERTRLTVVTNSLRAAMELGASGPRLILIGGELRRRSETMVGPLTRCLLQDLHIDRAFMGTIGLTMENGLTTTDPAEAFTKELVYRQSREVVLLADSSKMGKVSFARAGGVDEVNHLITDAGIDAALVKKLQKAKIKVSAV